MNKKLLITICFTAMVAFAFAQAPFDIGTYYAKAQGKRGAELKNALFEIIKNPAVVAYDSLWSTYNTTDARTIDDGEGPIEIIWDMYSGISRYPLYTYLHGGSKTPSVEGEGGIQREHSMPKAWFNPSDKTSSSKTYADVRPMYSDLTHLIPVDKVCNNNRSDLSFGEVAADKVQWQSAGGFSKKSAKEGCSTPGWKEQAADPKNTRVFEPNDDYKGDLARIYFYMVTCYQPGYFSWLPVRDEDNKKLGEAAVLSNNHCGTWGLAISETGTTVTSDMFDAGSEDAYQPFAPWALDMLMRWAKQDPVSQKEIDRNEAIWQFQGNRNPFVDFGDPNGGGLEDYIWGDKKEEPFDVGGEIVEEPTSDNCETALNNVVLGVDWSEAGNLRDYWSRTPISFEKDGITFTFSYGMEGKNLYADENEIRLYNYNTLTLTAHNNDLTKVELTVTGQNNANKTLVASVGEMEDNVWTGTAKEVIFASNYVSSGYTGGTSTHYYLGLSNLKVTVAEPSGIEEIRRAVMADGRIYNLMGVVMDEGQLKPGIYIKNGRKFIVK